MIPASREVCLACCAAVLSTAAPGRADEMKARDPDLPQPFDAASAQALLERSPFTRAVNLAESLQLTGVAFIEGKPVVAVKDAAANKTHIVSEVPNALGWKLESATPDTEFKRAEARIVIGSETILIHYSDAQLASTKKSGAGKGGYMPTKIPTKEEFTGRDEKGDYVRGMPYLSDEDRVRMRDVPREVREKFLEVVHDQRDMLFKASHEERAAFVKKAFDSTVRR